MTIEYKTISSQCGSRSQRGLEYWINWWRSIVRF